MLNQLTKKASDRLRNETRKIKIVSGFVSFCVTLSHLIAGPLNLRYMYLVSLTLSFLLSCVKRRFVFIFGLFLGQNDDKNVHTRLKIEFITEKDIFILLIFCCCRSTNKKMGKKSFERKEKGLEIDFSLYRSQDGKWW